MASPSASTLPAPALAASRAALNAALADQQSGTDPVKTADEAAADANGGAEDKPESLEPGEIQEVNMEAQAEGIRTVFNDPTNFNVKVRRLGFISLCVY